MQSLKESVLTVKGPFLRARRESKVLQSSVIVLSFKEFPNVSKRGIRTGRFQLFERVTKFDFGFLLVSLICLFQ